MTYSSPLQSKVFEGTRGLVFKHPLDKGNHSYSRDGFRRSGSSQRRCWDRQRASVFLGTANRTRKNYSSIKHINAATDASVAYRRDYDAGKGKRVTAETIVSDDGDRIVRIESDIPGKLLLHWGLEGNEGEGWRLPGKEVWPEGTVEYKRRALQTRFGDGGVEIRLRNDDPARYLNFVVKDTASGEWYDINGSNFHVPISLVDESKVSVGSGSADEMVQQNQKKVLLREEEIPSIPQDLSGVWSYMKWEASGCPNRSQEEADREYQNAIREIAMFLRQGCSLNDLQKVAEDGVERYKAFAREQEMMWTQRPMPAAEPQDGGDVDVDQDVVNFRAYLMWEQAGKPDGADFGQAARAEIVQLLGEGKTMEDIRHDMNMAGAEETQHVREEAQRDDVVETPKEKQVDEVQYTVGEGIGIRYRNPLDLIHRSGAPRLSEVHKKTPKPLQPLWKMAREDEDCIWHRVYSLGSKSEMLVSVWKEGDEHPYKLVLTTDNPSELVMHWGVRKGGRSWKKPDVALLSGDSDLVPDGIAAETPFKSCSDEECHIEIGGSIVPLQRVELSVPGNAKVSAISFVLRSDDGSRWWKDGGSDFLAPLLAKDASKSVDEVGEVDELSQTIIDCEVKSGAWTLMHRFNKASDLLEDIVQGRFEPAEKAMATIFVWLRYSAIRQLTWQRNYNTQPRILGAAQERLTHKISDVYSSLQGQAKEFARLCLTTVGRGGNAQAVRDEILNIMHRNKVKEVKGTWMEEFHQKLHNNTTPDDVGICEAYIAFLKTDGDIGAYWGTLSDHGITRERLESFDRPIVTLPEFMGDKKENLIRDFENYLGILKATHSGADLQASASAASDFVPASAKSYLGFVLGQQNSSNVLSLMEAAVECRAEINGMLGDHREIMYLDLALENIVRAAAERGAGAAGSSAASLMTPLLQNLALSLENNEEICYCLKAWQDLDDEVKHGGYPSKDQALRGMAVIERIRRALADASDTMVNTLQDISSLLGNAFGCEEWSVQLFAEEVVRGGPAFAVSLVLSSIEQNLRSAAEMGAWQVISPVEKTTGKLLMVPDLHVVADEVYKKPTILLASRVTGEEEVPLGVVGILSGDAPDVLSHLSVRCRNMKALFGACHEAEPLETLEELNEKYITITTNAAGAVSWEEVDSSAVASSESASNDAKTKKKLSVAKPTWCKEWSIGIDSFENGVVGAKSKNLASLRGKLPEWISLPSSIALPFGSFEAAMSSPINADIASQLEKSVKDARNGDTKALSTCRELIMGMEIPEEVQKDLAQTMKSNGISAPKDSDAWYQAFRALKAVWASKYNERAFTSTKRVGLDFDDVTMAVLVQKVVQAKYAFVIHTTNPMTGDEDEIYCELVKGMGESIVSGTVPGSALAFTAKKNDLENPKIVLYPSKSQGMFVREESLIFRSDSNGEDLEGYAGAGLYDSVTTAVMTQELVDYSSDQILTDPEFAKDIMSRVCKTGAAIEKSLKSPQDVEGVIDPDNVITVVQTRPQM
ncbi:Alpha-glucan water dikinase [Picochlorum sp. SENEW3]|nr:Alpha-glucan water dikinase [Picochlorum sp. SENEW3]